MLEHIDARTIIIAAGVAFLAYKFLLEAKIKAAGGFSNWWKQVQGEAQSTVTTVVQTQQTQVVNPTSVTSVPMVEKWEGLRDDMVKNGLPVDSVDAIFPLLNVKGTVTKKE